MGSSEEAAHRRAVVRAALLAPSPLARYHAGQQRRAIDGDLVLSDGMIAGEAFRHVLVLGPTTLERVLARAGAFFAGEADFTIEVAVEWAGGLEKALKAKGWRCEEEEPALVLTPIPPSPPAPTALTIRLVADEVSLATFRQLTGGARYVPSLAAATDPAVALLLGFVGGEPVATARLACLGAVVEIHSVVTLPAYRRRGYATALTWAAVAEGVRRGATAALLTATALGYPVYVKMGFQPVCTFRSYAPPGRQG